MGGGGRGRGQGGGGGGLAGGRGGGLREAQVRVEEWEDVLLGGEEGRCQTRGGNGEIYSMSRRQDHAHCIIGEVHNRLEIATNKAPRK